MIKTSSESLRARRRLANDPKFARLFTPIPVLQAEPRAVTRSPEAAADPDPVILQGVEAEPVEAVAARGADDAAEHWPEPPSGRVVYGHFGSRRPRRDRRIRVAL